MKNSIAIFIVLVISSCNLKVQKSEKADASVEKEVIENVLNSWHKDAAEANFEMYFSAMSSDGVFVGTDVSEVWDIKAFKEFSKPYFDKGKAWSFKAVDRNIYFNNDESLVWFDEVLDTWMGVCRGSGVLKKTDNSWKIAHYVLSLTIPNENIQEVIKVNKVQDSLYLNKFKN